MTDPDLIGESASGIRIATVLAVLSCAVAAFTLFGFAIHGSAPAAVHGMSITAALLCLIVGGALLAAARGHRHASVSAALLACLLGCGVLANGIVANGSLGALFAHGASGWIDADPSSLAAAGCGLLLGCGLLARRNAVAGGVLAVAVMVIAGSALLGHVYGIRQGEALVVMPPRTAGCLLALAVGLLATNRRLAVASLIMARDVVSRTTRRQLGFLIAPPIIAWVLLQAILANRIGTPTALTILVILTIAPLVAQILRDARALTELDLQRQVKEMADARKLAAEARYHSLFTSLDAAFCVVAVGFDVTQRPAYYRIIESNPAFGALSGLLDATGEWMRDAALPPSKQWFDRFGEVARTGLPVWFEHHAEVTGRCFDVSAFRIDGPSEGHVAILFNDITDRITTERRLAALNDTLEKRVEERASELEKARDALRQAQKLEAIGRLTGGVAHDFNNLLTVILGSVQMLRLPNVTAERRNHYVDAVEETAQRAAKLTGQLLAFARRKALAPEIFDVGGSLTDVMVIVTALTGVRITIDLRIPEDRCFVSADRSQFDTAIVNMALNARDAMAGEGRIDISCAVTADIPALPAHPLVSGDFVAITVADSGEGIGADAMERIFEPFFTTKAVGAGTGLGLSQVFGFAKQSGGDVHVRSAPGQGAAFTMFLPKVDLASDTPIAAPPIRVAAGGRGLCVLIVEDNAEVGHFDTDALRELGYASVLVPNADEALRLLGERETPDIIFCDVAMPGMSGLELHEAVRNRYPGLPVLLTSGYSHVLAETGHDGFELLHKPYSIEQLSAALCKVAQSAKIDRAQAGPLPASA